VSEADGSNPTQADTGSPVRDRGPRAFETLALCPACGAELIGIKCKTVCSRCRLLVENCSGD
jgi:hypothetical protein